MIIKMVMMVVMVMTVMMVMMMMLMVPGESDQIRSGKIILMPK